MSDNPGQFKPGQSGNPGGRPRRLIGDLAREARRFAPMALATLVKLCRRAKTESVRYRAAAELLDRGYGKPVQMIDANILQKKLSELTPDELRAVEARLLSAAAEAEAEQPRQLELLH
jgi:hypothetical protein